MKILLYIEKFLAISFWSLAIFGFDLAYIGILTILAATAHELAHIIAIVYLRKRTPAMPCGKLYGFRIETDFISYKDEIIIAAAGPLINIIIAIPILIFARQSGYFMDFAIINLMTALSNLFIIEGYDGYKILHASLSLALSNRNTADIILPNISFFLSSVMCFISLYFMLKVGEGFWASGIFLAATVAFVLKRVKTTF